MRGPELLFAEAYRPRVGMFRRPVFRRESHPPEGRPGRSKLETNLGLATTSCANEDDFTFLLFLSALVFDNHLGAGRHFGSQHDQGTVGTDGKCLGFLFESSALDVGAANQHRDLHEDALAAPPSAWTDCRTRGLTHATSHVPL